VRSITRTPSAASRLRCCAPVSSSSRIARSISCAWQSSDSSCALPEPMNVAGSGRWRFCICRETTSAPAVSARLASSSSDSSLSVEISIARSADSVSPPFKIACRTRSSASSISCIHSACGMRPGLTGPKVAIENLSYSISPRNDAMMPVARLSATPTEHIESNRSSRSACVSTSDSRASPPGCVCMQRKPASRSRLRRRCSSGSDMLEIDPIAISSTAPLRSR